MTQLRIAIYHNLASGGAKRMAVEHLNRLALDHHVALFSLNTANHTFGRSDDNPTFSTELLEYKPLSPLGSPFGRLNTIIGLLNVKHLNRLARQTAALIDSQNFDVVLVHPCQVTQTPMLLRWLRTPSLYYCHELPRQLYESPIPRPYRKRSKLRLALDAMDPLYSMTRLIRRRLDAYNAQHATKIITNSQYTAAKAGAVYQRKIDVCYPGVDTKAFQPRSGPRERFVLSIGTVTPEKGYDFLVAALATIPEAQRPPLVLISNFQNQDELKYLTSLAEQQRVKFECHSNVTEAELYDWYARAGCVAYSPIQEPLGLVALEAMAACVPLVGVKEGGVAETIVDQETGVLTARDPAVFGNAIQRLLDEPERASQLGQAARQYIFRRWTWDHHMEQIETHLYDTARYASHKQ